ncbi:AEC family transporter [Ulvibacter litoralis]|uniref:Uncharacterized protein n=1 Tax=Ulvibacter litoralis TaxID=227084 RepID=A0A1G7DJT5_9FLAO|nr:AEC family transporter [Ulvibacter litoralis]SDE51320.1 hypothetical protein SAMN05421855_1011002 [Ulvibacter litoralis]
MQLLLLIGLIFLSVLLTKKKLITSNTIRWATRWVLSVALPAVALMAIPSLEINKQLVTPILAPLLVFFVSAAVFFIGFKAIFSSEERLVLALLGGLGNTSFLGFPFISFFYGMEHLSYAVVYDQIGFLLLVTVAQVFIAKQKDELDVKGILKRILLFPPFIALCIALFIPSDFFSEAITSILKMLSASLSPVAMVIVGYQIAMHVDFVFTKSMFYGIGYKLLVAPMLIFVLFYFFNVETQVFKVTIIEAAMAPMVTPAIILTNYKIAPKLTAQIMCWGIIFSFVTVPLWYWFLEIV